MEEKDDKDNQPNSGPMPGGEGIKDGGNTYGGGGMLAPVDQAEKEHSDGKFYSGYLSFASMNLAL